MEHLCALTAKRLAVGVLSLLPLQMAEPLLSRDPPGGRARRALFLVATTSAEVDMLPTCISLIGASLRVCYRLGHNMSVALTWSRVSLFLSECQYPCQCVRLGSAGRSDSAACAVRDGDGGAEGAGATT